MSWGERLLNNVAMIASATVPMYLAARGVCRLALEQQRDVEISMDVVLWDMMRFFPTTVLYLCLELPHSWEARSW
jgi:hypothetical protein